jgi:hypothetical protein
VKFSVQCKGVWLRLCIYACYSLEMEPPATTELQVLVIQPWHGSHRKRISHYCVFLRYRWNDVSTQLFPSNGCCTVACLHSCYSAMSLCMSGSFSCGMWRRIVCVVNLNKCFGEMCCLYLQGTCRPHRPWELQISEIYCHVFWAPWLITTGSGLVDWIYWRFCYNYNQL